MENPVRSLLTLSICLSIFLIIAPEKSGAQATPDIPPPPPPTEEIKEKEEKPKPGPVEAKKPKAKKAEPTTKRAPPPTASLDILPSSPGSSSEVSSNTEVAGLFASKRAKKSYAQTGSSQSGTAGLVRISRAGGGTPKTVRLGFGLDLFSSGAVFTKNDELTRVGAGFSLAGSPIEHLELWLNTRAQSTTSNLTNPTLLQAQGDFTLGVKGFVDAVPTVAVGGDLQLTLLSGIGESSFDSAIFQVRGLASFDLSKTEAKTPVQIHVNFGGIFDGSSNLTTSELSQAERFALGISDYNRLAFGFGIEVPVKYITPFIEYTLEIPLEYLATPGIALSASDNHVSNSLRTAQAANEIVGGAEFARPAIQRTMPQRLTPGVRVTAIPNLSLDFAVEIGLTPEQAPGVPTTPPFTAIMLASYIIDPLASSAAPSGPPVTIPILIPEVKKVEVAPKRGFVMGRVTNLEGGAALKNVIISSERSPPVATSVNGRFLSHEIDPGPLKIKIEKEGFKSQTVDVAIAAGETAETAIKLEPAIKRGRITGRIVDAQGQALNGVTVRVLGEQNTKLSSDADGMFQTLLPIGDYRFLVSDVDRYKSGATVKVEEGRQTLNFTLSKISGSPLVRVKKNQLKSKKRTKFEKGDAQLSEEAKASLDIIVHELMVRTEINKLRVESHVDNANDEADNVRLTRARAQAAADYIISRGIESNRILWEGVGSKRARAPNMTKRGRARNRRLEFHIVN